MRMYGRRRQISAEETAANAAKKAARLRASMTCQCCATRYLANTGTIAHHGYQRPGYGWQTASCMGAKHLPFEVGRDALGAMLDFLKARRVEMVKHRNETAAEQIPIRHEWTVNVYENGRAVYYMNRRKTETKSFDVTRETFEEVKAINEARIYGDYETFKARELASRDHRIEMITDHINESQKRFDGWKQTHEWDADEKVWRAI